MMKVRVFLVVLTMFLLTTGELAAMEAPTEVVRSTTDQVLQRIKQERDALRQDPTKMYPLVAELIFPHFDFPIMARWVLGNHWKQADEASRAAFIEQFRKLLVRTYATALLEFSDQEIKYLENDVSTQGRSVVVRQEIDQPGGEPLLIAYRLHDTSGNWKVIDVAVDGVSLVKTYRASFTSIVEDGGLVRLIDSLAEKNREIGQ